VFGPNEIGQILLSTVVLGLAFTIALRGGLTDFLFSLLTVGTGFVGHELAHKFMAVRFGYWAAYQMWPTGIFLALALALGGFVFAALGAVRIYGRMMSKGEQGVISLAGPSFNILLSVFFMAAALAFPGFSNPLRVGAALNALIALFNCIPFSILDGQKIFAWDRSVWLLATVVAGILFVINRSAFT